MIKQGLFILISGLILVFNLYPRPAEKIFVDPQIALTKANIIYWEKITTNYPNYRDGYFKLAVLNWKLFNEEKTTYYLGLVRELDPNFVPLQAFPPL
ncbi:MAG: hypothetical protein Q7S14_02815 [bacterium]|nr:hypothetical protein [bacterium]